MPRPRINHHQIQARALFAGFFCFVLGVGIQLQQAALWGVLNYTVIVIVGVLFFLVRNARKSHLKIGMYALSFALVGFSFAGMRGLHQQAQLLSTTLENRDLDVVGVVVGLPQNDEDKSSFHFKPEAAFTHGESSSFPVDLPSLISVSWYATMVDKWEDNQPQNHMINKIPPRVEAGERWQMTMRVKAPYGMRNPYGFDSEFWFWKEGLGALASVKDGKKYEKPRWLEATWSAPIDRLRQKVRDDILMNIKPPAVAGLLAGLAVGDQSAINEQDWNNFRITGVAHLVSISGLHITLFSWFAALIVGLGWRKSAFLCEKIPSPHVAMLVGVISAMLYAIFSGWGIPAQRTCLMLLVVAWLRWVGIIWPWQWVWMLTCAVVVAWEPWALYQPGFWLSFVAVGILFAGSHPFKSSQDRSWGAEAEVEKYALKVEPWWKKVGRKIWVLFWSSSIKEQVVITLVLTPLTLMLFGQFSVVGLLANMISIPWISFVVTPLALIGIIFQPAWLLAAKCSDVFLIYINWLASFPFASLHFAIPPLWLGVVGMVGMLMMVFSKSWGWRSLGVPLVAVMLMWREKPIPNGDFEIIAPDIGQGTSILVRTRGHHLLFDAGPAYGSKSNAGKRVINPWLEAKQWKLDQIILSHRDTDHIGGATAVLDQHPQAKLLSSLEDGHFLLSTQIGKRSVERCKAGQAWDWDGVHFEIISPLDLDYEREKNSNAMSCVLRISNGKQTAMLTGDIGKKQEVRLLADHQLYPLAYLQVPHHGSKTSSSQAFVDAAEPKIALVQAGYLNRYGHPKEEVLVRYKERGAHLIESTKCGAYMWRSDAPDKGDKEACWRLRDKHYWHRDFE